MLEVRKWSETNPNPYDVVFVHEGKSYFQPGVSFSTDTIAQKHKASLEKRLSETPEAKNFILDHWEQD